MRLVMSQRGFTLVEITIGMAVFSFFLMIFLAGFLQITRSYRAGVAQRNAQQNGRFAMEEVVRDTRIAHSAQIQANIPGANLDQLCIWQSGQGWKYGVVNSGGFGRLYRRAFPAATTSNCAAIPAVGSADDQVSADNSNIVLFKVALTGSAVTEETVNLEMKVLSAASTSTDVTGISCSPNSISSQYCSVIQLFSSASLRGVE